MLSRSWLVWALLVPVSLSAQLTVTPVPAPDPASSPDIVTYNQYFDRPNNKSGWIYDTGSTLNPPYRDLGQTFTTAAPFYLDKIVVAISPYSDQAHLDACAGAPFHIDILRFDSINEMETPAATLSSQGGHLPAVLTMGTSEFLSFDIENIPLDAGKIYGFLLKFDSLKAGRYLELVKSEDADYYTGGKLLYTEFNGGDGRTNITVYKWKHAGGNVNRDLHFWIIKGSASGVTSEQAKSYPVSPLLLQSYPNPFNGAIQIRLTTEKPGMVTLHVFDRLGRERARLYEGFLAAGVQLFNWNGDASDGLPAPSGIYYIKSTSGGALEVQKITLLR